MKLDFNIENTVFGEKVPNTNTGKVLSVALMQIENTDGFTAKKLEGWAKKLRDGETLELDEADAGLFKQFIESPQLPLRPFIRNQISTIIAEAEKSVEKK